MKTAMVSLFESYKSKSPINIVSLYDWVTNPQFREWAELIRSIPDKKKQRELKSILPCITPSGIFSYCKDDCLDKHSGFICVDIDGGESNPGLTDWTHLKKTLAKWPFIAYCGLSISGNGIFCLIPIKYPAKHKEHFFALEELFWKAGINIDSSCKNVSRLRGASYDPNPVVNLEAVPFVKTVERSVKPQKFMFDRKGGHIFVDGEFKAIPYHMSIMIKFIDDNHIDITGDRKQWFSIGCSLASEYGEDGRAVYHEFSKHYKNRHYHYTKEETDIMFDSCLRSYTRYNYTIGTFFHYCKEYGVI